MTLNTWRWLMFEWLSIHVALYIQTTITIVAVEFLTIDFYKEALDMLIFFKISAASVLQFSFFFFLSFTLLHPTLSQRLFSLLSISFVCTLTWNIHSSAPSVSRDDVSLSSCDYYLLRLPAMACSLRWCRDRDRGRWVKCLLLDPWSLTPLVEKHRNHDNCCTMAQDSRIQHFSVVRVWGGVHH